MQRNINSDVVDIVVIVDDFNHLLAQHNREDEFEYISHCFGKCDMNNCAQIKKHYRKRSQINAEHCDLVEIRDSNENIRNMLLQQIMDKIHCHYYHSCDIGFRLDSR